MPVSLAATAASSSSPDAVCVAGANMGICGSCAVLGSVPSDLVGGTAYERREPRLIVSAGYYYYYYFFNYYYIYFFI